jgi:hypothetical protein
MGLSLGAPERLHGNVTTLIWIGPRTPDQVEQRVGYGAGRLSGGYWVALLKEKPGPEDFEFEGTTLRSGGREGLPAASEAADALRPRIHDRMIAEYGEAGYRELQQRALGSVALSGPNRIAKVVPATGHDSALGPDVQYPMGGGGLQWKILRPGKLFLIAMHVDAGGRATTPGFAVDLGPGAAYENRDRVMRYLETA